MDQLQEFTQQLKNHIRPSNVIGKKVKLTSGGTGRLKGLCPFHNEKTPSFYVSDDRNSYHCFGCGAHGDIISFVQETQGLSFIESVEYLAKEAGLTMPNIQKQSEKQIAKKSRLENIMQFALNYFSENINKSEYNFAQTYLTKRGLSKKIIKDYSLGYAPKGNLLLNFFPPEKHNDLIACGLARKNDKGQIYDLFQERVIFPIFNHKNEPIAFGGRVLGDKLPKYLNSPETDFFKKKNTLYNYNNARKSAVKKHEIIVTEGYMDVLALVKFGFTNCVAPLGTAFSEEHLFNLWRVAKNPIICLDGDQAGKKAMARIALLTLPHLTPGFSLKFITLPENHDPDDFLNQYGSDKFQELLDNAENLSDVVVNITKNKINAHNPESKAELEKTLYEYVEQIKDQAVRKQYSYFIKDKLWEISRPNNKKIPIQQKTQIPPIAPTSELNSAEYEIIYLLIKHPEMLDMENIIEEFCDYEFHTKEAQLIQDFLLNTDLRNSQTISLELKNKKLLNSPLLQNRLQYLVATSTNTEMQDLENLWIRTQKLYFLAKMRIEYRNFLNSDNSELADKALEILKDIQELEISINNLNNDF